MPQGLLAVATPATGARIGGHAQRQPLFCLLRVTPSPPTLRVPRAAAGGGLTDCARHHLCRKHNIRMLVRVLRGEGRERQAVERYSGSLSALCVLSYKRCCTASVIVARTRGLRASNFMSTGSALAPQRCENIEDIQCFPSPRVGAREPTGARKDVT